MSVEKLGYSTRLYLKVISGVFWEWFLCASYTLITIKYYPPERGRLALEMGEKWHFGWFAHPIISTFTTVARYCPHILYRHTSLQIAHTRKHKSVHASRSWRVYQERNIYPGKIKV